MPRPSKTIPTYRLYIAQWIRHLELKQRDIAKKAGCSESYISLLKKADEFEKSPSLFSAKSLADAMKIKVDDFFRSPRRRPQLRRARNQ